MLKESKNPDREIKKKSIEVIGNVGKGLKKIAPYIPDKKVKETVSSVGKGAEVAAKLKKLHDMKKKQKFDRC